MNVVKTLLLMSILSALLVLMGGAFGGREGALLAFVVSLVMNFGSYWFSSSIVLRAYRARVVTEAEEPNLVRTVARLAERGGLPMPTVAVIPQDAPNAFATGRGPSSAVVAVTTGLMRMVDQDELEGVLAHELGHVKNRDVLLSTIAAAMVGAITMISRWGLWFGGGRRDREGGVHPIVALALMILAPMAAVLIQMAISRNREFGADRAGAEISGKPRALASALAKLERYAHQRPTDVNPATSHLFIVNPLGGGSLSGLFRTHPKTEERIARLEELAMR
jgi:heat shock protein HtpX